MARRITLTRDERIVLQAALDNSGNLVDECLPQYRMEHVATKLAQRGLVDQGRITNEGLRAMATNRQTKPKEAYTS
jgi:hypothetical protein